MKGIIFLVVIFLSLTGCCTAPQLEQEEATPTTTPAEGRPTSSWEQAFEVMTKADRKAAAIPEKIKERLEEERP